MEAKTKVLCYSCKTQRQESFFSCPFPKPPETPGSYSTQVLAMTVKDGIFCLQNDVTIASALLGGKLKPFPYPSHHDIRNAENSAVVNDKSATMSVQLKSACKEGKLCEEYKQRALQTTGMRWRWNHTYLMKLFMAPDPTDNYKFSPKQAGFQEYPFSVIVNSKIYLLCLKIYVSGDESLNMK